MARRRRRQCRFERPLSVKAHICCSVPLGVGSSQAAMRPIPAAEESPCPCPKADTDREHSRSRLRHKRSWGSDRPLALADQAAFAIEDLPELSRGRNAAERVGHGGGGRASRGHPVLLIRPIAAAAQGHVATHFGHRSPDRHGHQAAKLFLTPSRLRRSVALTC